MSLDYEAALSDLLELVPDAHLSDVIRIVDAALAGGEKVWFCRYTDFSACNDDPDCYARRSYPNDHKDCGWVLVVGPLEEEVT